MTRSPDRSFSSRHEHDRRVDDIRGRSPAAQHAGSFGKDTIERRPDGRRSVDQCTQGCLAGAAPRQTWPNTPAGTLVPRLRGSATRPIPSGAPSPCRSVSRTIPPSRRRATVRAAKTEDSGSARNDGSSAEPFTVGDDRWNSYDSRLWNGGRGGGVPTGTVTGTPFVIWLSSSTGGLDWSRVGRRRAIRASSRSIRDNVCASATVRTTTGGCCPAPECTLFVSVCCAVSGC